MRRRARETFVLGAERVFDEAELDLRNEAEADHEPTIELDHAAPAEPAITPQAPPAAPSAGAGAKRGRKPSGLGREPRRPRLPVRAVLLAGAAALAVALIRGGGDEAMEGTRAASTTDSRPVARTSQEEVPSADSPGAEPPLRRDHPRRTEADVAKPDRATAAAPPPRLPAAVAQAAPAASVPSAPVVPGDPAATTAGASGEPVQSAASVRQEFGP